MRPRTELVGAFCIKKAIQLWLKVELAKCLQNRMYSMKYGRWIKCVSTVSLVVLMALLNVCTGERALADSLDLSLQQIIDDSTLPNEMNPHGLQMPLLQGDAESNTACTLSSEELMKFPFPPGVYDEEAEQGRALSRPEGYVDVVQPDTGEGSSAVLILLAVLILTSSVISLQRKRIRGVLRNEESKSGV